MAASLPERVEAADLTINSKLPFKLLSLRELLLHRVSALATPAVDLFEQRSGVAAVVLTRAVVETVAVAFVLHKRMKLFLKTKDRSELDEFLMKCLMGSRWKDASHQAQNVLTFIDHVEKEVPGFRASYEALCEYTHPNWSGVLGAFGKIDKETHTLHLGPTERTTVFATGINALCGSLLTMQHFYNDMVDMVREIDEYFEQQGVA